jgi:hypothetical protein
LPRNHAGATAHAPACPPLRRPCPTDRCCRWTPRGHPRRRGRARAPTTGDPRQHPRAGAVYGVDVNPTGRSTCMTLTTPPVRPRARCRRRCWRRRSPSR